MSLLGLRHLRGLEVVLMECGSFNPIHLEHIQMLLCSRDYLIRECGVADVKAVISPVADSYGKAELVSSTHRLAMARLAVEDMRDWIRVDDFESGNGGWMRTLQVLRHHAELLGSKKRLVLVGGADMFNSLVKIKANGEPLWNPSDVQEIVSSFGIIVVARQPHNIEQTHERLKNLKDFNENVALIDMPGSHHISSSAIRARLAGGAPIDQLVNPKVVQYIREQGLYGRSL